MQLAGRRSSYLGSWVWQEISRKTQKVVKVTVKFINRSKDIF
jgi:hypothetical protein